MIDITDLLRREFRIILLQRLCVEDAKEPGQHAGSKAYSLFFPEGISNL